MKIITTLIFVLSISPAYAKIFKCEENGLVSYQQTPCKGTGGEFIPGKDISLEQQQAAVTKLNADLAALAEKKQLEKEANDKERIIRAEEDKADATYQNARANKAQALQAARQAKALEKRNDSLKKRKYVYPNVTP